MAFFGRRRDVQRSRAATVPGRRLTTTLDVPTCVQMFQALTGDLAGADEFGDVGWTGGDPPARVLAAMQNGRPTLYIAVWDRGTKREVNLVPADDPTQLPQALIGRWKMQDPSLSSTGTVVEFPIA